MSYNTADLCDEYSDELQIADPVFADFGGITAFSGPIATVKTFEDNSLVRATLETPGKGRVLVVDGGGSMRCALLGDNLAQLAIDNDWAGIVINGCIRDSDAIGEMRIGVKALATHPLKSVKNNYGQKEVELTFAGITLVPSDWLYADLDGIVVSEEQLSLD